MAGKRKSVRGGGHILGLLSGRKKTAGFSAAAPLEIGDPYDFIDTQSLKQDTPPAKRLRSDDDNTRVPAEKETTPVLVGKRSTHVTPSSSRVNTSSRFLSEEERLQKRESEEMKKAVEASLLEKEREDRKRRRETIREKSEQSNILHQLQQNKDKLRDTIKTVNKARDLCEQDVQMAKILIATEHKEEAKATPEYAKSTQPLPSTKPDTKQVRLSMRKVSIRSLKSRKRIDVDRTINKSIDGDGIAKSIAQDESLVDLDDATPPLSRETSIEPHPIPTAARSVASTGEQLPVATNTDNSYFSGGADLDLATAGVLTRSSNLDPNTQSSGGHSMPFQVVSHPSPPTEPNEPMNMSGRARTRTPPPTEPNEPMNTSGMARTQTPPPTEPNEPMNTSGRARTRISGLSLSRKKRKRASPERILFQEMDNASPMKLPQVKRIKSVEEVSEVVTSKEEEVIPVNYAAIDELLPSATPEDVKKITCDVSDSNVDQSNCFRSLALSTQDTCSPPMHTSSQPSMDTHSLKPSLPTMYCPPGSSPHSLKPSLPTMHCPPTGSSPHSLKPSLPMMYCPPGSSPHSLKPSLPTMYCPPGSSPHSFKPSLPTMYCPPGSSPHSLKLSLPTMYCPPGSPHSLKPSLPTMYCPPGSPHSLKPSLPTMYCPPGSSPTEHTPKIIERFNSYFSQLREAQSKVLTRLKWGDPVKMGTSQQLEFGVTGRRTRRSKNAEGMTNRVNLILPKRNRTTPTVDGSSRNETFSLCEESTPEEKDGTLTQQSTASQLSTEHSPMNSEYDQAYDAMETDAMETDAMETDAVRSPEKSNSIINGSQPVSPTDDDDTAIMCDDLIVLNTQGEVTTPPPHIQLASEKSQKSLSASKRSTRSSTGSQGLLPETVSQKTPSSKQKESSPLNFDKQKTPRNWLNSRSQKSGNSKPTSNRKRTPTLTMKRQKTRKPPKSAAAKMILEFAPQSESDEERVKMIHDFTPQSESWGESVPEKTVTPQEELSDEESVGVQRRNSLRTRWGPLSSDSEGETRVMAEERTGTGVIDLTEDTQGTSPPPTPTRHTRSSKQQLSTCPLCSKQFLPSVIEVHASQCDGLEISPSPSSFRTKQTASRSTRRSYQPTLHQLQAKEKAMSTKTGDHIDSDSDVSTNGPGPTGEKDNPLLDELSSALDGSIESDDNHVTTSPKELRVIPTEDGGFMVDESTISNSPIRSFTKISDMAAKDRERYKNQFNRPPPKSRSGGPAAATGGTWSSDFGELAGSGRGERGRGRGGRGRGRAGVGKRWKSRGKGNRFSKRRPRN